VTNCGPRRVNHDDEIFTKFMWVDNAEHVVCETSQLLACRNNRLACLAKLEL